MAGLVSNSIWWFLLSLPLTALTIFWALFGRGFVRVLSYDYAVKRKAADGWLANHAMHEDGCHVQYKKRCTCGRNEVLELVKRSI